MKNTYKCKGNGNLGRQGKLVAMCGYIKFGDKSLCGAHGNTKCEHKEKLTTQRSE